MTKRKSVKVKNTTIDFSDSLKAMFCAYTEGEVYRLSHANDVFFALEEIVNQELRNKIKYGHKFKDVDEVLEWCRKTIFDSLEDRGINLDLSGQE